MRSIALEAESTLTDRYQTTVPEPVRRTLRLGKRDKIHYEVRSNGDVVLTRVDDNPANDPVLNQFLSFLAQDMAQHPERLRLVGTNLLNRVHSLVGAVEIDLDSALSADDE